MEKAAFCGHSTCLSTMLMCLQHFVFLPCAHLNLHDNSINVIYVNVITEKHDSKMQEIYCSEGFGSKHSIKILRFIRFNQKIIKYKT